MRVCKFQGVDLGLPLDRFDLRRGLLSLSFGVGSVVCGGFGGSFPNKARLCLSGCLGLGRRCRSVKAASQDVFVSCS